MWWLTSIILAPRRVSMEYNHKFDINLDNRVISSMPGIIILISNLKYNSIAYFVFLGSETLHEIDPH